MTQSVRSDIGPFAMIPEWLLYSSVSAQAIRLFATLHRHDGPGGVHPGRRRLAGFLGCSVDTIDRTLAELSAAGAVTVTRRSSPDGDNDTNLYDLHFVRPGSRMDAAGGSRMDEGTGSRMDAAQTITLQREPIEEESDEESSPAVREVFGMVMLRMPRKFQDDELTRTAVQDFAEDFAGQTEAVAAALMAVRKLPGTLPFPDTLRKFMPIVETAMAAESPLPERWQRTQQSGPVWIQQRTDELRADGVEKQAAKDQAIREWQEQRTG